MGLVSWGRQQLTLQSLRSNPQDRIATDHPARLPRPAHYPQWAADATGAGNSAKSESRVTAVPQHQQPLK